MVLHSTSCSWVPALDHVAETETVSLALVLCLQLQMTTLWTESEVSLR